MSKQQTETLQLGGTPRADLLPASAREAIRRRPIVRRLVLAVGLLALVTVLAVAGATVLAFIAQAQLQAERDRSETLLAQQQEFADARAIDAALTEATNSRRAVTSAEIDWEALLAEVRSTLPAGVLLVSVDGEITDGGAPDSGETADGADPEPEPLRQDSVASIRINATSPTVPDVEAWLADLEGVTGFAGIAPPTSVVGSEGASYTVTIEFLLNEEAFLGRYAPETADAEEED
ncbi:MULTISPECIES: hypothetical protein [unclassified Microcella]|uniref:hypothetical protein n=1 Tax=unclassified Microcella TaxID=2630066 RepID=UPI0006FD662B|nr:MULTISPECIES: hypothetical protein [unclassified Microcella]KQV26104.1 hypothetical protein ASC54_04005 [Yonghaparkia sp. Root332]KRF33093.1 hypothetical protein ASG83_03650 [Yonghaparkia sp. Soil809]